MVMTTLVRLLKNPGLARAFDPLVLILFAVVFAVALVWCKSLPSNR